MKPSGMVDRGSSRSLHSGALRGPHLQGPQARPESASSQDTDRAVQTTGHQAGPWAMAEGWGQVGEAWLASWGLRELEGQLGAEDVYSQQSV